MGIDDPTDSWWLAVVSDQCGPVLFHLMGATESPIEIMDSSGKENALTSLDRLMQSSGFFWGWLLLLLLLLLLFWVWQGRRLIARYASNGLIVVFFNI